MRRIAAYRQSGRDRVWCAYSKFTNMHSKGTDSSRFRAKFNRRTLGRSNSESGTQSSRRLPARQRCPVVMPARLRCTTARAAERSRRHRPGKARRRSGKSQRTRQINFLEMGQRADVAQIAPTHVLVREVQFVHTASFVQRFMVVRVGLVARELTAGAVKPYRSWEARGIQWQ